MEAILKCIDDVELYIDDVGIFSLSWEDHMRTLDVVCERLRATAIKSIRSNASGPSKKPIGLDIGSLQKD
jgi:hypothetical protein